MSSTTQETNNTTQEATNTTQEANKNTDNLNADPPLCKSQMYSIFHIIMAMVAIYLSFRCNKGFDMSSFIVALCCPYIYIIYILSTKGTCGILGGEPRS